MTILDRRGRRSLLCVRILRNLQEKRADQRECDAHQGMLQHICSGGYEVGRWVIIRIAQGEKIYGRGVAKAGKERVYKHFCGDGGELALNIYFQVSTSFEAKKCII